MSLFRIKSYKLTCFFFTFLDDFLQLFGITLVYSIDIFENMAMTCSSIYKKGAESKKLYIYCVHVCDRVFQFDTLSK